MKRSIAIIAVAIAAGFGTVGVSQARAGLINDAAFGLGYAGFDIQGARNPLSGGLNFLINRNFIGNTLDFGAWDLTMAGPISLSASTGGRLVNNLDLSLRTAINGNRNNAASPLNYVFNYDVGGQSTQVTGSLFIDANFSVNSFGFYDLNLTYSTRQDVQRNGRFTDADSQFDADFGPISISGNIFADVLAAITDPFFQATGASNPFASFSASAKLNDLMFGGADSAFLTALADVGTTNTVNSVLASAPNAVLAGIGGQYRPNGALRADIPEPTVLVLMFAGIGLLAYRRFRRFVQPLP